MNKIVIFDDENGKIVLTLKSVCHLTIVKTQFVSSFHLCLFNKTRKSLETAPFSNLYQFYSLVLLIRDTTFEVPCFFSW